MTDPVTNGAPHAYDNIEAYIDFDHEADNETNSADEDRAPWNLTIPSPDGKPYFRRAWSPEPLVRSALKWARERGIPITVIIWSNRSDQ